ncbi:barstar family protein [Nocardia brasiliensis]|uniref:barstar family protein n=1 Tax=Nocardia brasiliensis TaxID=37326 RepID=UPI0018953460|nr:barstar family protein [Nocardia brasiliensis]
MFTEFAAAFQSLWYFGQNWAAFDECMRDLDEWLPPGSQGHALAVWNADAVLIKDKSALEAFVDSLNFIHQELAEPSGLASTGTGVASPTPRGFQVVLHCEARAHDRLISRWTRAGARLNPPAAAHL